MEQTLNQILNELKSLNNRMDNLESKVDANHKEVISKLDSIENQMNDLDPKNATRHIEMMQKIDKLSHDLNFVEIATGKNITDIAYLKSVK